MTNSMATARKDLYLVVTDWRDPETGIRWLQLSLPAPCNYDDMVRLPTVLEFDGDLFGRISWNSDTCRVNYRNRMQIAKKA